MVIVPAIVTHLALITPSMQVKFRLFTGLVNLLRPVDQYVLSPLIEVLYDTDSKPGDAKVRLELGSLLLAPITVGLAPCSLPPQLKSINNFSNSALSKKAEVYVNWLLALNILLIKYFNWMKGLKDDSKFTNVGLTNPVYWWFQSTKGYLRTWVLLNPVTESKARLVVGKGLVKVSPCPEPMLSQLSWILVIVYECSNSVKSNSPNVLSPKTSARATTSE